MRFIRFKDTHWEKTPSNKNKAPTKSMNMRVWNIDTLNQVFKYLH